MSDTEPTMDEVLGAIRRLKPTMEPITEAGIAAVNAMEKATKRAGKSNRKGKANGS